MDEISQWLTGSFSKLGNFFSIDLTTIIALVLFLLSYQLFRLVIVGMMQRSEPPEIGRVSILLLPGVLMSLAGIVLITNLEGVAPIIFYLTLTLIIGYGFAHLGYRLLDNGVLRLRDEQLVWEDHSVLIKRAAPGAIFALFGILVVIVSLSQGFAVVGEISTIGLETQKKIVALADTRLQEGLKLLGAYLQDLRNAGR